ncbi:MAG: hypothetical protein ABF290_14990 [Thiogranum sp.]
MIDKAGGIVLRVAISHQWHFENGLNKQAVLNDDIPVRLTDNSGFQFLPFAGVGLDSGIGPAVVAGGSL